MNRRPLSDGAIVLCAVAAAVGARWAQPMPALMLAVAAPVALLWPRGDVLAAVILIVASLLAARSLDGMQPRATGAWSGKAVVVTDPEWQFGQVQADLRVEGKHLLASARGEAASRLAARSAGDVVQISGSISAVRAPVDGWMLARHVAGRITVREVRSSQSGSPLFRLANGVRSSLLRSASVLPAERRSLFAGFILGDSRGESAATNDDFRAAGLTHLLVVSGQNVAFTLAALEPLLARMRRRGRLVCALIILLVFATVTRFEPSVLRASVMAALVIIAGHLGRPQSSLRILAMAATALLLVDPMLAHSVGFGLSIGACVGIALLDGRIRAALPGPAWLRRPLATTLAAQIGTMVLLVPIFGGVPIASIPANLLALPAAEPIMGWGVVAGLPAGLLGPWAARIVHLPTGVLLWWVAGVAHRVGSLPLGRITIGPALILAVLVGLRLAVPSVRGRGRPRRLVASGIGLVLAVTGCSGLHVADVADVPIARGVRLWRPGGWAVEHRADVLVVDHGAAAGDVLAALRVEGVKAVDLVVVRSGGRPQGQLLNVLAKRIRIGTVLAADRSFAGHVRPVAVAQAGMVVRAGGTVVAVDAVAGGRLSLTVTGRARGP